MKNPVTINNLDLSLPTLAVLGARSNSGAPALEAFVGRDHDVALLARDVITVELAAAELGAHLRAAVLGAASKSTISMNELQAAVCAFTVAARTAGWTPEAVLIAIKQVIHTEAFEPVAALSTWNGNHLHQTMSTWCIEKYFSPAEVPGAELM